MTLRIFAQTHAHETVVALHGRLTAAEVVEVERVAVPGELPLVIDLGQLVGADAEGFHALNRLRKGGARVTGASPFVELMLARVGAPGEAPVR